jgi:hypothetical protein
MGIRAGIVAWGSAYKNGILGSRHAAPVRYSTVDRTSCVVSCGEEQSPCHSFI